MPAQGAVRGSGVPIELLDDSEAALRRAEGLLAELGGFVQDGCTPHRDGPAPDAAIAARGLAGLGEDLRRVRVEIGRATGEIAWCLSEARALLDHLQRRVERVARLAEAAAPPAGATPVAGVPARRAERGGAPPRPVRRA
jgi:hypothetical protein